MSTLNNQVNIKSQTALQPAPAGTIGLGNKNGVLKSVDSAGVEKLVEYWVHLTDAQLVANSTAGIANGQLTVASDTGKVYSWNGTAWKITYVDLNTDQTVAGEKTFSSAHTQTTGRLGVGVPAFGPSRLGDSDLQANTIDTAAINIKNAAKDTISSFYAVDAAASDALTTRIKSFKRSDHVVDISPKNITNLATDNSGAALALIREDGAGNREGLDSFSQNYPGSPTDVGQAAGFVSLAEGTGIHRKVGLWFKDNGVQTYVLGWVVDATTKIMELGKGLLFPTGAASATPATGKVSMYAKPDKNLYIKDDTGVENVLGYRVDLTNAQLTGTQTAATQGNIVGQIGIPTDSSTALYKWTGSKWKNLTLDLATIYVGPNGADYDTIQPALDAAALTYPNGCRIHLKNFTHTITTGLLIKSSNLIIECESEAVFVQCDGAAVPTLIKGVGNLQDVYWCGGTVRNTGTIGSGIGFDWSNIGGGGISENTLISAFNKGVRFNDTSNTTFYNKFEFYSYNCNYQVYVESTSLPVNFNEFIIKRGNVSSQTLGNTGIYLQNAENNLISIHACEPIGTIANTRAVYLGTNTKHNIFHNCYYENNFVGVESINGNTCVGNMFIGGNISGNTTEVIDPKNNIQFENTMVNFINVYNKKSLRGGQTGNACDIVIDSTAGTNKAINVTNATNYAHSGNYFEGKFLNGSDSGDVFVADNAGTGNNFTGKNNGVVTFSVSPTGTVTGGIVKTTTKTVATLLSATTVGAGARSFVTDATLTTFGTAVVGAGINNVPVYSDGTAWRIG